MIRRGAPKGAKNAAVYAGKTKRYSLTGEIKEFKKWANIAKKEGVSLNAWILKKCRY